MYILTLSALEGADPSIAWGDQFDPHFLTAPGGLLGHWAIILSILIIMLFKERINDYLEKELGQYLEIGRKIAVFVGQEIF